MSVFPDGPRVARGGIVLIDPVSGAILRIIMLQYNPDTLTRTLQVQGAGEGSDRSEALRLKGPPVETLRLEADIDATDQLEFPEDHPDAVALGLHPQLAALEGIAYPSAISLVLNAILSAVGTIEIVPSQSPLTLFVWSARRVVPVRVTELSVIEEAFDTALNPTRARVTLGLRVLTVDDLGHLHRGGSVYMSYLHAKESLAARAVGGSLSTLGIGGPP